MNDYSLSIQNIVGSGKLPVELDTHMLGEGLEGETWMDDGPQPGLYWELDRGPQVTFHESGSYIIRADSEEQLRDANSYVMQELQKIDLLDGKSEDEIPFEVQNVVGLAELGKDIELRALQMAFLGEESRYEPEQFPALEFKSDNLPSTFLVYGNGKIIIAGADSVDSTVSAMESFYEKLKNSPYGEERGW